MKLNMKNLADFMKTLKKILFFSFITTNVAQAQANNSAHLMVQDIAESYVAANIPFTESGEISIKSKTLDSRINIPACPVALEAQSSPESLRQSNVTVRVYCPSNNWFHYLNVKVTEMQDVVVVNDSLSPGTLIGSDDIKLVKIDRKRLRGGTFTSAEDVIGARLKRRIRMGTPLSSGMLCYVCKGDAIVITASLSGLEIKTSGIAQQDGNIGQTIMVKNKRSKKIIDAQVTSVKHVQVNI